MSFKQITSMYMRAMPLNCAWIKSHLVHVRDKCLFLYSQNRASERRILSLEVILVVSETESLCRIHPSQKTQYLWHRGFLPPPNTLPLFPLLCLRKRSQRQQIEIANIHLSAEPSLDLSPNIFSVSICLQFLLLSLPPNLPPSCFAPIGSRSCSTGRLLAPSHQNLAKAARICPHTNRSLAFCLWMDGTESKGRDKVKGGKRNKSGGQLNV